MADSHNRFDLIVGLIDQATAPLRRIAKSLERVGVPIKKVQHAANNLGRVTGITRLTRLVQRHGKAWGELAGKVGAAARNIGLAATGAAAAGAAFIKSYATEGDKIAKTSDMLGITTTEFQRLAFAADRSGVSQDNFTKAFQYFTRGVGQAAQGTGQARVAFEALGISIKKPNGELKSNTELFYEAADAVSKVRDANLRVSVAMDMFGRSGAGMINLFKGGAKEVRRLGDEVESFGGVAKESTLRASEDAIDQIANLTAAFKGLGWSVYANVQGPFLKAAKSALAWLVANKELIQAKLAAWFDRIGAAASGFWSVLSVGFDYLKGFAELLGFSGGSMESWATVGKILAGVVGVGLVLALAKATVGVITFTTALLANPITWVILGVAALATSVWLIVKNWDAVSAWLKGFWDRWQNWLLAAGAALALLTGPVGIAVGIIVAAAAWVISNWDALATWWSGFWERWGGVVVTGVKMLLTPLVFLLNIPNLLTGRFGPLRDWFADLWAGIVAVFDPAALWEKGAALVGALWDGLKGSWAGVETWLAEAVDSLTGWMPDWLREKVGLAPAVGDRAQGGQPAASAPAGAQAEALPPAAVPAGRQTPPAKSEFQGSMKVEFTNAPAGMRVRQTEQRGDAGMELDTGITYGGWY